MVESNLLEIRQGISAWSSGIPWNRPKPLSHMKNQQATRTISKNGAYPVYVQEVSIGKNSWKRDHGILSRAKMLYLSSSYEFWVGS